MLKRGTEYVRSPAVMDLLPGFNAVMCLANSSVENKQVGSIAVAAWQMEERSDPRISVGRLPDIINGRVRSFCLSRCGVWR